MQPSMESAAVQVISPSNISLNSAARSLSLANKKATRVNEWLSLYLVADLAYTRFPRTFPQVKAKGIASR